MKLLLLGLGLIGFLIIPVTADDGSGCDVTVSWQQIQTCYLQQMYNENQQIISNQEVIKAQNSQLILQNNQMIENQNIQLCLQVTDHPDTWTSIGHYLTERGIQCKGLTIN